MRAIRGGLVASLIAALAAGTFAPVRAAGADARHASEVAPRSAVAVAKALHCGPRITSRAPGPANRGVFCRTPKGSVLGGRGLFVATYRDLDRALAYWSDALGTGPGCVVRRARVFVIPATSRGDADLCAKVARRIKGRTISSAPCRVSSVPAPGTATAADSAFAVSFRLRPTAVPSAAERVLRVGGSTGGVEVFLGSSLQPYVTIYLPGDAFVLASPLSPIALNESHHYVVVARRVDASSWDFFVWRDRDALPAFGPGVTPATGTVSQDLGIEVGPSSACASGVVAYTGAAARAIDPAVAMSLSDAARQ